MHWSDNGAVGVGISLVFSRFYHLRADIEALLLKVKRLDRLNRLEYFLVNKSSERMQNKSNKKANTESDGNDKAALACIKSAHSWAHL